MRLGLRNELIGDMFTTATAKTRYEADNKMLNPDLNASDNRMAAGQGWSYDAAGNVIGDPEGRTFTYDAENKQVEVENSLEQSIGKYWFDGDGKRIKKEGLAPNGQPELTVFVYNAGGTLIGEYSTTIESAAPKVQYLTADHLGSTRINTDQNGTVTSRTDYLPYGEEITGFGGRSSNEAYSPDDIRKGFTGYERDNESGLDFAQARYHSANLGRFSTPDPYNVVLEKERGNGSEERAEIFIGFVSDPQRWNLYVYVLNNPLAFTDPDGREPRTINLFLGLANEEGLKDWETFAAAARKKGYVVNIYTKGKGFTADNFLKSLKSKDTVTIFSGHSLSSGDGKRLGINFGDVSGRNAIGNSETNPRLGRTADGVDIRNDIVAVFSCDFGGAFDNISSSTGAAFVSIAQGQGDPRTMIDSVDRAARNFFESITETPINNLGTNFDSARDHHLRRATGRAEKGLGEMGYASINEGDTVVHRYLSRSKKR